MGEFGQPFRGSEALRDGRLTRHGLRTFRRMHRDVYVLGRVEVTAVSRARAAWLWANGEAVLAGFSAAAVHGTRWIGGDESATLIRRGSRCSVDGIEVRADALLPDEECSVDGMQVTTPARTAFDLGRWLPVDRAVEVLDALCHATGLRPAEISAVAGRHRGERGLARLRDVVSLVDPGAESPPVTRTRLVVIRGGLPAPTTQIPIADRSGRIFARADLGWERWKVLVEYDGEHHWSDERQRTWDIERMERLAELGWVVVRVNAEQLHRRPQVIVTRVRDRLRKAGAPV
ncbi:MAG: DUF559 domain-containing protein [Rhodococcus sp. (in: high G+C Gram-positive bacteria)]|nr:MAG: DUF559 domain-containing protein [Rhodococcus sp. (in: high G+C Gram-positive bacteria)]